MNDLKEKINQVIDEAKDNRTQKQIAKEQIGLLEKIQADNKFDNQLQIQITQEIRQWIMMV